MSACFGNSCVFSFNVCVFRESYQFVYALLSLWFRDSGIEFDFISFFSSKFKVFNVPLDRTEWSIVPQQDVFYLRNNFSLPVNYR